MLVVSDTSPLNYLVLIHETNILPALFDSIYVPPTVFEEMMHPRAPREVRDWAANPPTWIQVRRPTIANPIKGVHRGEAEEIALAIELNADALLVDDREAVTVALQEGLAVIGTLSLLARAIAKNLIELETVTQRLSQTNFWGPIEKLKSLVEQYRSDD
jgi:predicted nucleic acid-binding protein